MCFGHILFEGRKCKRKCRVLGDFNDSLKSGLCSASVLVGLTSYNSILKNPGMRTTSKSGKKTHEITVGCERF